MIIIPAIDIIDGKPVRLYQGDYNKKEVVGQDVLKIAKNFEIAVAEYIHLVDLEGAKEVKLINNKIIIEVAKSVNLPIEVGGGIRTYENIKYLIDNGISRVILGTVAIENLDFVKRALDKFGDKISIGVDCKNGYLCGRGWLKESKFNYIDFSKEMEKMGVDNIILTDISRDGTLQGVNIGMLKKLNENICMNITSSGGISKIDDIRELKNLNIYGVIIGKALYSKHINLKEAIDLCKENS